MTPVSIFNQQLSGELKLRYDIMYYTGLTFRNYGRKKFYNIGPSSQCFNHFIFTYSKPGGKARAGNSS